MVWKSILFELLHHKYDHGTEKLLEKVIWRFTTQPDLQQYIPILNVILGDEIPENEITKTLTGESRHAIVHRLLSYLLHAESQIQPLIIILDDAHL
jgi:hypothetical protein